MMCCCVASILADRGSVGIGPGRCSFQSTMSVSSWSVGVTNELDDGDDDDDDVVVWMMVGLERSLFCAHKILCWPTQNFV